MNAVSSLPHHLNRHGIYRCSEIWHTIPLMCSLILVAGFWLGHFQRALCSLGSLIMCPLGPLIMCSLGPQIMCSLGPSNVPFGSPNYVPFGFPNVPFGSALAKTNNVPFGSTSKPTYF